jgi:HEPN domain-containing protein
MSDAERIASFIALAHEELAAAHSLISVAPRQAAYFIQQSAEKASRAVLTAAGVPFGTSHNLGQMAVALPPDHPLRAAVNSLDKFSTAATKYRYPSPSGRLADPPSAERLVADVAEVRAFIDQVKQYLGLPSWPPRR